MAGGGTAGGAAGGGTAGGGTAGGSASSDAGTADGCFVELSGGIQHTCGLTRDGGVYCWGSNGFGQIGIGIPQTGPFPPPQGFVSSGATRVAAGGVNSCATFGTALRCWGFNNQGQVGDGTSNQAQVPVDVAGLDGGVTGISVATNHSCAVQRGGVSCWGQSFYGETGSPDGGPPLLPYVVYPAGSSARDVSAGASHSCAVFDNGDLFCWGDNSNFQLGRFAPASTPVPQRVLGLPPVSRVVIGNAHTCALTTSSDVYCWGYDGYGQLGQGPNAGASSATPLLVLGLDGGVTDIASGEHHVCAVHQGSVKCWGNDAYGQAGTGATDGGSFALPQVVAALAPGAVRVFAGHRQSCALAPGGTVCWGDNGSRQLGVASASSIVDRPMPVTCP